MIMIREVFQLKFGKAKEAKALWKEVAAIEAKYGFAQSQTFVDVAGPHYTFVSQTMFESLEAWDKAAKNAMGSPEFGSWYQKFAPLVESGRREIYSLVE